MYPSEFLEGMKVAHPCAVLTTVSIKKMSHPIHKHES